MTPAPQLVVRPVSENSAQSSETVIGADVFIMWRVVAVAAGCADTRTHADYVRHTVVAGDAEGGVYVITSLHEL